MIDLHEYRKLKHQVETLRLGTYDDDLRNLLDQIRPESNNPIDDHVWPYVTQRFDALAGNHETTGLINIPPRFLPPGFPTALQDGTDATINISKEGNAIFPGPPGSGKTTLQHNTMLAAKAGGARLFIVDPKEDHRFFTALYDSFVTIDSKTPRNLLARPSWRPVGAHIIEQVELYKRHNYSGEQQGAVLRTALSRAFNEHRSPSWKNTHEIVDGLAKKTDPYSWRDAVTGVSERLHKIKQRYPAGYATNDGIPIETLIDKDIYHPLQSIDPVGEWSASILLNHIFQRNKERGTRRLTTAAFIDEGIGLLGKAEHGRIGGNPLAILATMNREFGLWLCFTTVDLAETDPLILSTAATIGILPGVHERGLRLAGLSPLQAQTARHMRRGQVMFVYPGRLAWPVMARFEPLPHGLKERRPVPKPVPTPTPPEADDADRPMVGFRAPDGRPIVVCSEGSRVLSEEEIKRVVGDAFPDFTLDPDVLPAADDDDDPRPDGEAVLAPVKLDFLRYVGEHVVVKTKQTYTALKLHLERGNGMKQEMIGLGYLIGGNLMTHGGRGGGSAKGMMLTTAGYRRIGMTPPPRSVGTGLQGAYLCQQYLQLIPNSRLELDIAGKRPDIVVRIDLAIHRAFVDALNEQSLTWNNRKYELPDGALLAIECETGDATNVLRSVRNNLTKNRASGLQYIVFAVMQSQFVRVLPVIREDGDEKLLVVDAITFLDELRKDPTHV
ncbi:MAG: hypothetical protein ABI885_26535 [Gammaproteobacteria bacterium]